MSTIDQITAALATMRTPAGIAELFCDLDDDAQAQVFVHIARIMLEWGEHARNTQLLLIGEHMRECSCVTVEARELVADVHAAMMGTFGRESAA